MRQKLSVFFTLISITFFCGAVFAISQHEFAQQVVFECSTLYGLEEVTCYVKKPVIIPPTSSLFLSQESLQTEAELILRKAGIKVVSAKTNKSEALVIFVSAIKSSELPIYAGNVRTYLVQRVNPKRNNQIETSARTWPYTLGPVNDTNMGLFIVGRDNLVKVIKDMLVLQLTEFCNDYLAAQRPLEEQKADLYRRISKDMEIEETKKAFKGSPKKQE